MNQVWVWILVNWLPVFLWSMIGLAASIDSWQAHQVCRDRARKWFLAGFVAAEIVGIMALLQQIFAPREEVEDNVVQALLTYLIVFFLFAVWRGSRATGSIER